MTEQNCPCARDGARVSCACFGVGLGLGVRVWARLRVRVRVRVRRTLSMTPMSFSRLGPSHWSSKHWLGLGLGLGFGLRLGLGVAGSSSWYTPMLGLGIEIGP